MWNKKFRPVLRAIFLVVVSLILGINIYNWNAKNLTGDALPMPFGYGCAVVLSGSMEPAISVDELIIVKKEAQYAPEDVVVYQNGRVPVVHRIVSIDGETVITRGDANNVDDQPIERSQIKGKVIAHIPFVGKIAKVVRTPIATILLIIAGVLMVELPYRKEKSKKDEELERIKAEIRRLKEEQNT